MELNKLCDRCFRMVGDNEEIDGFLLEDTKGTKRLFKGHKVCVDEMYDIMKQLYRIGEEDSE